jgi:hypothetical protein
MKLRSLWFQVFVSKICGHNIMPRRRRVPTPGIHRAAVNRQTQCDRGRGEIRVLGMISGNVGSCFIRLDQCSSDCLCCYSSNIVVKRF